MPEPDLDQRQTTLFVLRLAHALHASGYAAHSLEEILQKVCDRLEIIGQFFTTPTAIFASNDDMAAATVAVAHRQHLDVPADISVTGFDDTAIASGLTPGETVVVDGVDKLQPGSKVAARSPSAAPPRS